MRWLSGSGKVMVVTVEASGGESMGRRDGSGGSSWLRVRVCGYERKEDDDTCVCVCRERERERVRERDGFI